MIKKGKAIFYEIGDKVKVPDGYLTYLGDSGKRDDRKIIGLWQCIDDCPRRTKQFECVNKQITSGMNRSCGCLFDKYITNKLRDESTHYLHELWKNIKVRCYNKNDKSYKNYGNRGITVQEDWVNDSKKFVKDLLEKLDHRPTEKHSLDRIDVNGNYEINNIRWATNKEQANNTRKNKKLQ